MVYGHFRTLLVERCPACAGPSAGGFCGVCSGEFTRVENPCPRCGLAQPVTLCPRTLAPWDVDAVLAPFSYRPPLHHYVHGLKYRGMRTLGRAFALLVVRDVRALYRDVDALVAVPLHRTRLYKRGYNQAHEIARTLGRELALPTLGRGITRRAVTIAQTGQGARQRRAGVAMAFRVDRDLTGRRIGIVDDVVTTGATVNALAAALRAAGAAHCVVFAVARTAEPDQLRNA